MSSSTLIIMCLIGIVISIAIGYKWGINMGVTAMAFAYIIGCFFMNLSVKAVVLLWPTRVFFQVMAITLFFGFGIVNGTMQAVANHLIYACRNRPWAITFALFSLGVILGIIAVAPPVSGAIMAVMLFTVAIPPD